ncbi:helix-turn-helix domain-containing protein, partial [Undibacterium sp.]|uniref:helix-turn-helix domain-containing protein n=1 Tax=Undibacterium sp. TaxID=1914977 RepID=UPI003751907D
NVRELRNVMERVALFLSATPLQAITPNLLSKLIPEMRQQPHQLNLGHASRAAQDDTTETIESATEMAMLMKKFNNNREDVAQYLGISRTTLWRRLKSFENTTVRHNK